MSFNNWRGALSTNRALWAGGTRQKRHGIKGPGLRGGRFEGAVIDAPWLFHLPKLVVW